MAYSRDLPKMAILDYHGQFQTILDYILTYSFVTDKLKGLLVESLSRLKIVSQALKPKHTHPISQETISNSYTWRLIWNFLLSIGQPGVIFGSFKSMDWSEKVPQVKINKG